MKVTCVLAILGATSATAGLGFKRPNIVFLMSDDQDKRLGSMDFMQVLQKEMIAKGTQFLNHHTTTAQCCPSRSTLLRGQAAHNTNVTNVFAPGGNYEKFRLSGQGDNYLPHWMKAAGYRTEYLGKFLNGVNLLNWASPPPGWDHIDFLLEPYQTTPNRVVMSENGDTPRFYHGFHQTDVIRAKALDRLEHLAGQNDPFLLFISPTAPHVDDETSITQPCARHMDLFPDAKVKRTPNFNPSDEIQNNKASWIRELVRMDKGNESWSDMEFRNRAQALMGIDEMLGDILAKLEEMGELDSTYVIYTSDNGYHLGQHRMAVGKTTPFAEDTNLPLVVRGPGIPVGVNSSLVSAHLNLAPTFLDIAGVAKENWPSFLDGRSLLEQWKNPNMAPDLTGQGSNREVLNVEYWGTANIRVGDFVQASPQNTYKTLRIVGDNIGYLYTVWCRTNEVELYDTVNDPYELTNIARNATVETRRLMSRLNAMLLVTKGCSKMSCQNTWETLVAGSPLAGKVSTLKQALDPQFDSFFNAVPKVSVKECLGVQLASNEVPFWPPGGALPDFGLTARNQTPSLGPSYKFTPMLGNEKPEGGIEQRHVSLVQIMEKARVLTKEELDPLQPRTTRSSGAGNNGPNKGDS